MLLILMHPPPPTVVICSYHNDILQQHKTEVQHTHTFSDKKHIIQNYTFLLPQTLFWKKRWQYSYMTDMDDHHNSIATVDDADGAGNEYGLHDLARLPLLEQVHRLFHAIQHQYPYKEVGRVHHPPFEFSIFPKLLLDNTNLLYLFCRPTHGRRYH